jgi:hypothetical protein
MRSVIIQDHESDSSCGRKSMVFVRWSGLNRLFEECLESLEGHREPSW